MTSDITEWLNDFDTLNPDRKQNAEVLTTKAKKGKAKKEPALDLFNQVLPALDKNNKKFYENLTPDEQKDIEPWLLMRWVSCVDNNQQAETILNLNYFVNDNFSVFSPKKSSGKEGYKELQWKLLTLCRTLGKSSFVNRKWIPPPVKSTKNKVVDTILEIYPYMSDDEAELFLKINTRNDIEQMLVDRAFSDDDIEDLLGKL